MASYHSSRTSYCWRTPHSFYGSNFVVPCRAASSLHSSHHFDRIHHNPFLFVFVIMGKLFSCNFNLRTKFWNYTFSRFWINSQSTISLFSSSPYIPVTNCLMRIITIIAPGMELTADPMIMEQIVNRHNLSWMLQINHLHYQMVILILAVNLDIQWVEDTLKSHILISILLLLHHLGCILH